MSKETRRQQRIEELQRRWEDLHRRLGVLASSKIKETRPEEQIRLATPEETAAVETVVQELSNARLLTTGRDAASGEELLDVSHEALIRNWPRLRAWLEEDRDALRFQRKLGELEREAGEEIEIANPGSSGKASKP